LICAAVDVDIAAWEEALRINVTSMVLMRGRRPAATHIDDEPDWSRP